MITRFEARNFRCFGDLRLNELSRFNLIAGKNNTGKTALLEAIHLHNHPNDPPLSLNINKYRSLQEPEKDFETVLDWLFPGKHPESGLELTSRDENQVDRKLSMWLLDAAAMHEQLPEVEESLPEQFHRILLSTTSPRLILGFEQTNEPPRFSLGVDTSQGASRVGMASISARISWSMPDVFISSAAPPADQDVKYFGEVEASKRQAEVLPALRLLEPRLQKLALVPLAGESVIHGDIGLPRLVPIVFMGEGLRRVLSMVLAIANVPGGIVLIDEIENGLHYSVQEKVWTAIAEASRRSNVQIFATTHSWECIEAAHRAFKASRPYELRYYRLDRRGEETVVKVFDERMLDTVEKSDLEVR